MPRAGDRRLDTSTYDRRLDTVIPPTEDRIVGDHRLDTGIPTAGDRRLNTAISTVLRAGDRRYLRSQVGNMHSSYRRPQSRGSQVGYRHSYRAQS